ncbi:hypothetical protein HC031_01580 [Planosporangium thailandense]|uniref:Uncharacterized protein n=1 Tax=Planosporangium thailandense TaxID=765197 RepID=A0ABX0XT51_9ACTN|nr:hypothetical protein [Planosporangium thailandense]NJC68419.1 hypothetical protein [Planosporangium thailandense]
MTDEIEVGSAPLRPYIKAGVLVATSAGIVAALLLFSHHASHRDQAPARPTASDKSSSVDLNTDRIDYVTDADRAEITVAFRLRNVAANTIEISQPSLTGPGLAPDSYVALPSMSNAGDLNALPTAAPSFTPTRLPPGGSLVLVVRYRVADCHQALTSPTEVHVTARTGTHTAQVAVTPSPISGQAWNTALARMTCTHT